MSTVYTKKVSLWTCWASC